MTKNLDHCLSPVIRIHIEQQYYAHINARAELDQLATDIDFISIPEVLSLFSDHGVVQVRDVAQQILQTLDVINVVLIPAHQPSHTPNPLWQIH